MTKLQKHVEPGQKPGLVFSSAESGAARSRTILLVCRKCEKKLKRSSDFAALRVKKSLKRAIREDGRRTPLRVLSTGCMKICPKGGVTVCAGALFARSTPGLIILRSRNDIFTLYQQCIETYSGE